MLMWRTNSSKVGTALLWLVAWTGSFAADIGSSEQQLSISDPRPVAKAVEVLSQRHGIVITYEDPAYAFEGDLKDVTAAASRSPLKPGQRVLIPRGGAIQLSYSLSTSTGKPDNPAALVRKVLDTWIASGGGSQFELIQQGDAFHVVPVMVRGSGGAWVATRSVLDTPITLALRPRSGTEMVDAICSALSAGRVRVAVGMAPESALANAQVAEGGTNEPARDILSRTLNQLSKETASKFGEGGDQAYVWQLLFDPTAKSYFLNLSVLPRLKPIQKPKAEQPDPAASDPNTSRR
jgi:hypothetical protein